MKRMAGTALRQNFTSLSTPPVEAMSVKGVVEKGPVGIDCGFFEARSTALVAQMFFSRPLTRSDEAIWVTVVARWPASTQKGAVRSLLPVGWQHHAVTRRPGFVSYCGTYPKNPPGRRQIRAGVH